MSLLKRDGRTVPFNVKKIEVALNQANAATESDCRATTLELIQIRDNVATNFKYLYENGHTDLTVEDVQLLQNFVIKYRRASSVISHQIQLCSPPGISQFPHR